MEKKKKFLRTILIIMGVILLFIILRLSNIEEEPQNPINPQPSEQPTEEPPVETVKPDISSEENPIEIVEFTEKQKKAVDEAFQSFMDYAEYQTTLNEGDSTLQISFKGLGTVTFKLYEEYVPDSIDWLQGLIEKNTQIQYDDKRNGGRLGMGTPQFQFITTDRHYNREEQVPEIFPMKYCLYHIGHSSNNFYFCTLDYVPNTIDSHNVPEEYLNYLSVYGGNMSLYGSSIVLGRAVENEEILDRLDANFQLESMTMIRNGETYTVSFATEDIPVETIAPEESVPETVEQTPESTEEPVPEMTDEPIEPSDTVPEEDIVFPAEGTDGTVSTEENPIIEE